MIKPTIMKSFIVRRSIRLTLVFLVLSYQSYSQSVSSVKLFRFGDVSNEKPGVVIAGGKHLDVSSFGQDYDEKFFASDGITRLKKWLEKNQSRCPEVSSSTRIASCISRPS